MDAQGISLAEDLSEICKNGSARLSGLVHVQLAVEGFVPLGALATPSNFPPNHPFFPLNFFPSRQSTYILSHPLNPGL